MTEPVRNRPEFRNINAFADLPSYRLPAAGWVSILHRISGALMFLLLPFIIWLFDKSAAFNIGVGLYPAWFISLVTLALVWAYLHHLIAGLRHLYMDATHSVDKAFSYRSAVFTLVLSLGLTVLLGAKLFSLY